MLVSSRLHARLVQSRARKAGVGVSHLAAPAITARHLAAPCRHVHAAAAGVRAAAAATDAAAAEPAEQPTAAAEQPATSSSSNGERNTRIRIGSRADTTKTAAYISSTLADLGPRGVLLVSAVGPAATLAALKTLAKASELTAERQPGQVLTLEPRRRLITLTDNGSSSSSSAHAAADDAGQQQQAERLSSQEWFVRQEPAEQYSTEPAETSRSFNPMRVRPDTDYNKVAEHARRQASRVQGGSKHAVAAFSLLPGGEFMQRSKALMNGLSTARQQLCREGHTGITVTLQRTLVEIERKVQQQDGSEAAAAGDEAAAQQQDTEDSSSSSADAGESLLRPSYLVRVYVSEAREDVKRSERKRSAGSSSRPGTGAGSARRGSRPGYVEVPAAEWAALREQLEVVPHLTQQLQTMTRQHEQLLSLLAAQQQQQEGGAGQAAAAAAPEAEQ